MGGVAFRMPHARTEAARMAVGAAVILTLVLASLTSAAPAEAAITVVGRDQAAATALAEAAVSQPGIITGAAFEAVPPAGNPHGISGPLSHLPTAGEDFALLTTGSAGIADMDNVSGSSGVGLGGGNVRGNTDYDVTVLAIDLDVPTGRDCLRFDFAFYSEEYPEWVGTAYNDAFIAELDDSTWATSGSSISAPDNFAFDPDGNPISINSAGPTAMSEVNAGGTTYDGATVLLEAATPVTPGEHTLYLSIFDQGDDVYDSAAFVDNIRVEQTVTTCEPGAQSAQRRPLIFLHGITGSILQDADGNEVWPDAFQTADRFNDEHLDVLKLADDGVTPDGPDPDRLPVTVMQQAGIEGILDLAQICVLGLCYTAGDAYHTTFELLEDDYGYTRGEDLFPFAYDWRLSIEANGQLLLDKIDEVLAATGEDEANIMAHSQGGLVTSAALSAPGSAGKVDRVVTLGTPYLGATKFLGVLDYAEPCQADAPFGTCFLNRRKAQELSTNWPGALALLPSRAFYAAELSAVHRQIDDDGDGEWEGFLSYDAVRDQLADRNLALIDQADALHQGIDGWSPADPDVRLFRIVGDTSPTITRIIQYEREHCTGIWWWRNCEMREEFTFGSGNGDGTVPLASANLHVPHRGFDLRGAGQNAYAGSIGHGELVKEPGVLDFAVSFLSATDKDGSAAALSTSGVPDDGPLADALYAPAREEPVAAASSDVSALADPLVLRDEPLPLAGTEVVTRGPLVGEVVDGGDGRLGTVDAEHGIELTTIPASNFFTAGSNASYFVTRDGPYSGSWLVTEDSEITFTVRRYDDDEISAVTAAPGLALLAGARLSLDYQLPTSFGALALQVDEDGDGTVDRSVPFGDVVTGETAADNEPPVTDVTVERVVDGSGEITAHVTMSATDTGGSGVDRIEYALDATEETGVYGGPFEVPAVGLMVVRAIDRAGNVESPYQIIALDEPEDDAPNHRGGVTVWHDAHANIAAFVDYPGDVDWWGFELEAGRHQFQLIGLTEDYDLELRDGDGALVASSDRPGKTSERIVEELDAGRYHLVVQGADGAYSDVHAYRMNVTRLGNK